MKNLLATDRPLATLLDAPAPQRVGPLPRVLYVTALEAFRKFGSMEEQIVILAQAFRARGSLFLPLFLPAAKAAHPAEANGWPVECLDLRPFHWKTLRQVVKLIRENRIELLHWHFYEPLANPYLWMLTLLMPGVRHWYTDHTSRLGAVRPDRHPKRLLKRLLLRRYHRVIGVSRFVQECLRRQGCWSNLCCCLHFVNTERFRPDAAVRSVVRAELGVAEHFVLLTAGHLIRPKGVDVLLHALRQLPESVLLWIVGDGEQSDALRSMCRQLNLDGRVRFLGLQRNVQPYMQAADLFVCPSIWAEAAGLVNIEAGACGLPVVASRVGGIPEYVNDGTTGFLVPPGDPVSLAQCIARLCCDAALHQSMGRNARQWATEHFSAQRRLEEYLDLYRGFFR
jgi:glycosyltransferase involved in cell wall biosynthesis